jgi:hypothetical protein
MNIGFWYKTRKGRGGKEDLDIDGRIILKWILKLEEWNEVVWIGVIWLRIGSSGGLLRTQ